MGNRKDVALNGPGPDGVPVIRSDRSEITPNLETRNPTFALSWLNTPYTR